MGRSREGGRLRLMGEHLRRHPVRYTVGFALLILSVSAQLFIPQLLQSFADTYAAGALTKEGALRFGGWLLLVAVVMAAARIGARIVLFHLGRAYERNIRSRLFAQWLRLPVEYYQQRRIGDLMAHATNDINLLREKLNHGFIMTVETAFLAGLSLSLMATTVHPWLTLAAFVPLPFLTLTAYLFRRRTQAQSHRVQQAFGDLNAQVQQFAAGIQVIKGFVQEAAERERFDAVNRANREANRRLFRTNALFLAATSFIIGTSFFIALTYGGWLAIHGVITLGQFIAFYSYLGQLIFPIENLGRVINLFQRAKAAEERIGGILRLVPAIRNGDDCVPMPEMKGHVAVRNLTFAYPGSGRPALRDVRLDIPAGSTLGIVGKVGSGKTTLVQLLLRLFDPPPGTIFIDGVPIEKISLDDLRRNIAYVPQDGFLFSMPIRDNIDFHPVSHSEGEIVQAATRAHVHDNILEFPRKYDTLLGERGIRLSGGQRQRVAIARALLKEAPVLVFDDSFSAVDADTESRILRGLRRYARGRTTIIVSHRVASVQHADQIIVMDEGRIVERGTHEQLLQAGGLYAALAKQQMPSDGRQSGSMARLADRPDASMAATAAMGRPNGAPEGEAAQSERQTVAPDGETFASGPQTASSERQAVPSVSQTAASEQETIALKLQSAASGRQTVADRRLFRWMMAYARPYWPVMGLALLLSLLLMGADVARPYLVKVAIDHYLLVPAADRHGLLWLGALFFALVGTGALLQFAQHYLLQRTGQHIIYHLRRDVFTHLTRLPMAFFDRHSSGSVVTRVCNDTETLHQLYAQVIVNLVKEVLLLAGILAVMWHMSPRLTVVCLALIPVLLLLTEGYRRLVREARRLQRYWLSRLNASLAENLAGMAVIQAFVREDRQQEAFEEVNGAYYRAGKRVVTVNSVFQPLIMFVGNLALALLVWRGGVAALDGNVTFGVVFAFTQYVRQFFRPLASLADRFTEIQSAMASAERLYDFFLEPAEGDALQGQQPGFIREPVRTWPPEGRPSVRPSPVPRAFHSAAETAHAPEEVVPHPTVRGDIRFEHVWFAYEDENWVLKDIHFHALPGQTVALVGETGAGKSSITRLLLRFYEWQKGTVLLDGVDIRRYPLERLRGVIGLVPQDVFLFAGTIRDNITLQRPVDEARLERVVRMVGLDRLVRTLPAGLDTPIGERGVTLSMGQRQLLAFARAMVDDPPILILDEATAHIDTASERDIQAALERISGGRTMIVVAHRLSTIRHADQILVLEKGRIVEAGTHDELMAVPGRYRQLYTKQHAF